MQSIYTQIMNAEKRPKERQGRICYCYKCGATNKTLCKLTKENYICIECKKNIDTFVVYIPDNHILTESFANEEYAKIYYNKLINTCPEIKPLIELRILYKDGDVETILKEDRDEQ